MKSQEVGGSRGKRRVRKKRTGDQRERRRSGNVQVHEQGSSQQGCTQNNKTSKTRRREGQKGIEGDQEERRRRRRKRGDGSVTRVVKAGQ